MDNNNVHPAKSDNNIVQPASVIPKTPITNEQFKMVCQTLSTEGTGLIAACEAIKIAPNSFYKYMEIIGDKAEQRYAHARGLYIETKLAERDQLNAKCLNEIKHCDEKRCNALQSYYRELSRQIEWELSKLRPKRYGDHQQIEIISSVNSFVESTIKILKQYVSQEQQAEVIAKIQASIDFND